MSMTKFQDDIVDTQDSETAKLEPKLRYLVMPPALWLA
jgi:hypothetical protein